MSKENILKKYEEEILGEIGHIKYFTSEFKDKFKLINFLYSLDIFESNLTDKGLNFLKEYYGLNKVVGFIIEAINKGVDFKWKEKKEIIDWLERKGDLHPNAIVIKHSQS